MPLDQDIKTEIIAEFKRGDADTGSAEVQIALLSRRIKDLTQHLKVHKHDYASTRGLKKLVGQRRQLLKYLNKKDVNRYRDLCTKLGIKTGR
jgi:small subunit ribosomal protein S15